MFQAAIALRRCSQLLKVLLALVLLGWVYPILPAAAAPTQSADYAPAEVLVRPSPGNDISAIARDHQLASDPQAIHQLAGHAIYQLKIVDGATPTSKANEITADPRVIYAEPDYLVSAPEARQRSSWAVGESDGPDAYQAQWAPVTMGLSQAHSITRGAGISVAVLDTGVDLSHPAFAGRLVAGFDFVSGDENPSEVGVQGVDYAYGHGTHVAGLVALAAPDAKIMPLRTLAPDGVGTIWAQIAALRFAVEHGADVINLSFSFRARSQALDDVLAEVTCISAADSDCRSKNRPGAVVVAASGNSGMSVAEYPAADNMPSILAVAASTQADTLATFSTYGPWVTIAAPGESIISSVPGGAYASWSGTSMAAPLAAGTLALMRAVAAQFTPAEIVARASSSAAMISAPVRRRLDAAAAVRAAGPKS